MLFLPLDCATGGNKGLGAVNISLSVYTLPFITVFPHDGCRLEVSWFHIDSEKTEEERERERQRETERQTDRETERDRERQRDRERERERGEVKRNPSQEKVSENRKNGRGVGGTRMLDAWQGFVSQHSLIQVDSLVNILPTWIENRSTFLGRR